MVDAYREVETKAMIVNITKSSIAIDESSNHVLEAYFFYTQNNMVVNQLKGSKYFAYDSISELFKGVYCWNAFLEEAAKSLKSPESQTKRKQIINRRTIIYFLNTHPPTNITMLEFTEIYRNVTIINHYKAKECLQVESVIVGNGCRVQLEHVTVHKIDATYGGKAHLHKCNVGWNLTSTPFLFCGGPNRFDYNICGMVSCNECTTINTSGKKKLGFLKSPFRPTNTPTDGGSSCIMKVGSVQVVPSPKR
jgi:hypothetical protein